MSQNFKVKNGLDINGVQVIAANGQLTGPAATQITNIVSNSPDTWVRTAANSASSYANSSYNQANTATTNAATADQRAVTSGSYANSAYTQANTATTNAATADQRAVTSGSYANSAYSQSNTATTNAATADQRAVTSGSYANSAYNKANTAGSYANSAYNKANTAGVYLEDQTSSSSTYYPLLSYTSSSGTLNYAYTSSSKLTFIPEAGLLTASTIKAKKDSNDYFSIGGPLSSGDYQYWQTHTGLTGSATGRITLERNVLKSNTANSTQYYMRYDGIDSVSPTLLIANGEVSIIKTSIIAQSHGAAGSNTFDGTKTWQYTTIVSRDVNSGVVIENQTIIKSNTGNSGSWTANANTYIDESGYAYFAVQIQGENSKNIYWTSVIEKQTLVCPFASAGGGGK